MMLSEKQLEIIEYLDSLKKQIELLDSHKVIKLINDKQYQESLETITHKLDRIEVELGIREPETQTTAFDLLFGESIEKYNNMLESVDQLCKRNDELYNQQVHDAVDEVFHDCR